MKPLFEIPILTDLDGIIFNASSLIDPGAGSNCTVGCESGCKSGCNKGEGANDV